VPQPPRLRRRDRCGRQIGADILYLTTAFAARQLVDLLERERPDLVVHDEAFADLLDSAPVRERVLGWSTGLTEGR
jgi:fatty-acyl-CoA synthase